MRIGLSEILTYLDEEGIRYKFKGKENIIITKYASFKNLHSNCISWIKNQANYKGESLLGLESILLIIQSGIEIKDTKEIGLIMCENPKEAFFSILNHFFPQERYKNSISPSATVYTSTIGDNVYIGHQCYIGKGVIIEDSVVIKNNVSIEGNVKIGKNTIIHSGVVIGSDGFGYYQNHEGTNIKVSHYGGVIIGRNVEIGANTCIDRGTLDDTIIGDNVKIDNLCHIAHNCIVKDNSSIIALSMLGGSVMLEKNAYIAPGVLIMNQIHIGENSLIGMGAVVIKDVEDKKVVAGVPAKVIRDNS